MSRLNLSLACWNYDRIGALADGSVVPDGIDLNLQKLEVEETFFRMIRYREFDVSEMSLSSYVVMRGREDPPFIALPVFPSRFFRHSCIFVSAKSGIREPKDLVGKRIGVPEYQLSAIVWIRGILQDEYGVDPASVTYHLGGEEQPGREEKIKVDLPERFKLTAIPPEKTLSRMLADGEIDAIFSPRTPSTFYSRPDDVLRLFPDFGQAERDYYARTRIFPIMHVLVVRRELYERHRWIAQSLYKAFAEAKRRDYEELISTAALKTLLPWQTEAVEQTIGLMGDDWWPYGLEPNRKVLDTFLRYHHEQGLSPRRLTADELFAPETAQAFKI